MLSSISRKAATQIIFSTFEMFHFGLISMYDLGIKNEKVKDDFFQNAWKLDRATNTDDYIDTLHSLDAVGFKEYYKLVGVFAKKYKIANWKDYNDYEPIQIEQLNLELVKHEKTDEKLDLIDSFTVEELQSEEFIFASKVQVLYDILDDWLVFDDKEHGINKLLESFNSSDKSAFIIKMQSDRRLLDALINKVNGIQKDEMFALLGEIFISSEFITGNETTSLYNDKNDTINADFDGRKVNIDVLSTQHNGMRDYRNKLKQHLSVSPFEIIIMNYYGSQIRVPALLLLNSWSNGLAEPEVLFYNYRHEDIDWNKLSDTEKDEYFYEFVAHYLPSGFVEALGSPLQMVITGIITVGLAIATGGASAIAELEVVLAASGLALTGVSLYGSIRGIMAANDMKVSATTMHEAKKAAKVMAQNVAQLSLNVIDLLLTAKDLEKLRNTKTVKFDSASPEDILRNAGYKRGKEIDDYSVKVKELQKYYDADELTALIKTQKDNKKSAKNVLDDLLEKHNTPKIEGLYICDGKVDGKIPLDKYKESRKKSIHNPESNEMTFGRYDVVRDPVTGKPILDNDGNAIRLPSNYIEKAGNTTYFDLGKEWEIQTNEYWLDHRGKQLFNYYNRPAIDDAINSGKQLRFSHDPRKYHNCALEWEWNYIKNKLNISDVDKALRLKKDGFWYVTTK